LQNLREDVPWRHIVVFPKMKHQIIFEKLLKTPSCMHVPIQWLSDSSRLHSTLTKQSLHF